MKDIPFTQYLRPDGKAMANSIPANLLNDEVPSLAQELLNDGYCFECEVLTTGIVSLTCDKGDDQFAIELSPNGPEVIEAVNRMIIRAHTMVFNAP